MKLFNSMFFLTCIISLTSYCAHERTRVMPFRVQAAPRMLEDRERQQLVNDTRELAAQTSCCARSSRFKDNMERLTAADGDVYNTSCCTTIGTQQCLYKSGCTCEHPCAPVLATGLTATAATTGVVIGAITGCLPVAAGVPTGICLGIPAGMFTCCGACEIYNKCKSGASNQLDYISNPKNWSEVRHDDHETEPDYNSGYESLDD